MGYYISGMEAKELFEQGERNLEYFHIDRWWIFDLRHDDVTYFDFYDKWRTF